MAPNPSDDPVERKIQLTGGTTYTVSLPKSWARDQSLSAGSRVQLHPRGDRLLLTQPEADDDGHITAVSAGRYAPDELAQLVAASYVAGADAVRIDGVTDTETAAAVREAANGLIGVAVDAESARETVVRTMLDATDLSARQTLAQMESLALSMHADAVDAVLAADAEAGERVAARDDTVDRLFGLVAREFQRSLVDVRVDGAGDGLTTFDHYAAARQIERVADHAERIGGVAGLLDDEPPADVAETLSSTATNARTIVRRALSETLGDRDPPALTAIVADGERVVDGAHDLDRELYERDLADGYAFATVLDSVVRTAEYGVNVAEGGLQAALRESRSPAISASSGPSE